MDRETEARLKKKIMAGEELTEEEKANFVNYDEWKVAHDKARADTIAGLRWNAWPALFICAFFLLSTAFNNTRFLIAVGWQNQSDVLVTTIASWILGIAAVIGSFWMKNKAAKIARAVAESNQLMVASQQETDPDDE